MLMETELLEELVDHLPEGMIVMDKDRTIHYLNEKAVDMTGWKLGEKVPYCTYCQERELEKNENRCILTADNPIPFFNSHLAVYEGLEEFEMSLKKMTISEEVYYVLRIRPPVQNENSERARFHELLVQETLLLRRQSVKGLPWNCMTI